VLPAVSGPAAKAVVTFSGASDPRFDDGVLHELDVIHGTDLEVVDTSSPVNGP
jgi:hypothetical protein